MGQGDFRVGTSGWVYRPWRGAFYPVGLPQKDWFAYYAERFDTAEINATFYRLPSQSAVAAWREAAPPGFQFAWKASRYITQAKKLRDAEAPLARVYAPMAALGDKSGPTLFQLPPQLHLDIDRLERFLTLLPPGRQTIEFRHPTWFNDAVFDALARHDVALCVSDHHDAIAPWISTASFAYVRGHGPGGEYHGPIATRRCGAGRGAFRNGADRARTSTPISTTTSGALRRVTPCVCVSAPLDARPCGLGWDSHRRPGRAFAMGATTRGVARSPAARRAMRPGRWRRVRAGAG